MGEPAIRAEGLSKRYRIGQLDASYDTLRDHLVRGTRRLRGRGPETAPQRSVWALEDVSFEIGHGEVVGIIGRNGAGKTTLLRILTQITEPTKGRALLWGHVGSLLEVGTGFHPELTGRENVLLNGVLLGMPRSEVVRKFDEIVEFAGLERFIETPVKRYSTGMRVRLAFAVAAHLEPEILLIDEVLAVGDAEFQRRSLGKMEELGQSGRTVLFVSHNMPTITRLCPRAILLDGGHLVEDGPSEEVVARYLSAEYGSGASRVWSDDEAPGNDVARIRSLRFVDRAGDVAPTIDVRELLGVEVEFDLLRDDVPLVPWLALFNEQGAHVFSAFDTDPAWREAREPGRYVSSAWIPENLLNEGTLVAHLNLQSFTAGGRATVHAASGPSISCQVIDPGSGDTARGHFAGVWTGPVRPLLEWSTQRVDALTR
jgi:lipopolysaccharide transport system ATP-binding protein